MRRKEKRGTFAFRARSESPQHRGGRLWPRDACCARRHGVEANPVVKAAHMFDGVPLLWD